MVPWPHAWAFALGLVLIVWGGISAIGESVACTHRLLLPSVALILPGFILVLFSASLSSPGGTVYLAAMTIGTVALFRVQRRYGKWSAVSVWAVLVAVVVYMYARNTGG